MQSVVIASSRRKQGKTLVAQAVIPRLRGNGRTLCFAKMRRHAECALRLVRGPGRAGSDTWRCAEAGADRTVLVEYSQPSEVAGMTAEIAEGADTVIWEGNSIAGSIDADLLVYIDGGGEERKDPALRESAHLLAEGPLDPESATRLAVTALGLLGAVPEGFCVRGKHWIELQGSPIMGDGRARLLEAVDSQGSILGASRSTGIPYKRAWTHIREAERSLGARLILPVRGGAGGGGTRLSPLGRRLLEAYRRAEAELRSQLEVIGI